MTANDNLSDAVARAVDWAETIPANVSITQHADFNQYFGSLDRDEFGAALTELERRADQAWAEAKEMIAFVDQRAKGRAEAVVAARTVLASIGYDPNWTNDQLIAACAGLTTEKRAEVQNALRVGAAAYFQESDLLEIEGRLKP